MRSGGQRTLVKYETTSTTDIQQQNNPGNTNPETMNSSFLLLRILFDLMMYHPTPVELLGLPNAPALDCSSYKPPVLSCRSEQPEIRLGFTLSLLQGPY